jgi:hypothetical protein
VNPELHVTGHANHGVARHSVFCRVNRRVSRSFAAEGDTSVGVSIYYTASRLRPLTPIERTAINAVVARYPVETLIAECGVSGGEYNGEAFCVYPTDDDTDPGVVFDGATKLPLCSQDAFWSAVQYWCRLLSEVRRVFPEATWRVRIDDHDIGWDEELRAFDPST